MSSSFLLDTLLAGSYMNGVRAVLTDDFRIENSMSDWLGREGGGGVTSPAFYHFHNIPVSLFTEERN